MKYPMMIPAVLAVAGLTFFSQPLSAQVDEADAATQIESEAPPEVAPEVPPAAVDSAAPQPEPDAAAAEQAMNDLLGSRKAAPIIEPNQQAPSMQPIPGAGAPAASVDIDPAVLGIAPGDDPPPLRREGEFIVNRRGRLIQSAQGGHRLFVFESDAMENPELPMVLQACQLLEAMEDTVQRRGDATVFILSGQINTYRGANYLLPTMMKIAVDKGNLTN